MAKTILTLNQAWLLKEIAKDSNFLRYFYLTGGTALSEYYLHHRLSEDLDFFSENEIDTAWLTVLVTIISKSLALKSVDRRLLFQRNLIFFNFQRETVKTEFTYFPVPQIEKPTIIDTVLVDSLVDIAVNKFFTIYQNPSSRHFIDLYLILKTKKYSWKQLEKLARIKFDTHIDPIQLGSQLVKASDIAGLPNMLINVKESEWRNFFTQKAKSLKNKVIG